MVSHTCVERCVRQPEGGGVEVGIEIPVVGDNQPVRPPPAARGELEKEVPHAVSNRAAHKEIITLIASVLVRAESMSVYVIPESMNQATRTCIVIYCKEGNKSPPKASRWPPQKNNRFFVVCERSTTKHRCLCLRCGTSNFTSNTIMSYFRLAARGNLCRKTFACGLDSPARALGGPGHETAVLKFLPLGHLS